MLEELEIVMAKRIAKLADAARAAHDRILAQVRDSEPGEPPPVHGRRDPEGTLGLAVLPDDEPALKRLREAISLLRPEMRRTLWVVMRIGEGDYARGDWEEARAAADGVSDERITVDLADDVELHEKLMKGLYELGVADPESRPG